MKLKTRYNQFIEMLDKSSSIKYTDFQKNKLFVDFLWSKLTKKTYLIDYIQYEFYNRNSLSRESFLEYNKMHKLIDIVNNKEKEDIFNSKILFNRTFKSFLNREWIEIENTTEEEFINFANRHKKIIVKPQEGSFGIGIEIFETDKVDLVELYKKINNTKSFVESVVDQHPDLAKFNDTTLNTLRMVTMVDSKGQPHVMDAILRIGRSGKHTDNFHNQGLACIVDIDSGRVYTIARDKNYSRYILHPDSNEPICGFKVPSWDKVITKCKELALVVPDVRYVGWDIAINSKNEVVCIEGNYSADPDASQAIDQVGKYQKYYDLI